MASPDFTQSITHPAHLPVIYVMLLFTFLVACICTLGGLQETGTTHKFSDVNVKNDLNVDGTLSLTQGTLAAQNFSISGNLALAGNLSGVGQTFSRMGAVAALPVNVVAGGTDFQIAQPANTVLERLYVYNSGTIITTGANNNDGIQVSLGTAAGAGAVDMVVGGNLATTANAVAESIQPNSMIPVFDSGNLNIDTGIIGMQGGGANAATITRTTLANGAASGFTPTARTLFLNLVAANNPLAVTSNSLRAVATFTQVA